MTFAVPAPKSETDPSTRFEFTLPGSKREWAVPLLRYLPVDLAEQLLAAKATAGFMPLFGAADEPLGKAVRSLTGDQIAALIKAWGEASGVTVGESSASPSS